MPIIYRLLGAFAKADSKLARIRVNAIPSNWILLFVAAYGVYSLVSGAVDATTNSPTPLAISLSQLDAAGAGPQHYIRVSGEILPTVIYRHETDSTTEWWSPLVDRGSGTAVLVKRTGNIDTTSRHAVNLTGMLRRLDAEARQRVAVGGGHVAGLPVDLRYELVADERPGDPHVTVALAVLASLLLLLWITVMVRRDDIFGAGGNFAAPLAVVARQPILLRVTGRFRFNGKTARRFTDVPAVLTTENGQALLQSRIDTSGRFLGVSMGNRVGIWSIAITPGSVAEGRFGFSYFGLSRRYAYRFSYVDAGDGKRRCATIAADEPHHLMMAVALAFGSMSASFASVS
jgi:hypothetical protein